MTAVSDSNTQSLLKQFRQRWVDAAGEYIPVKSSGDVGSEMVRFLQDNYISSVVLSGAPLTWEIRQALEGQVEILADFGQETFERNETIRRCSEADAGITGVDGLIASTGTLITASRGQGDRLSSSLPSVHIAVAVESAIYENLEQYLKIAPRDLTLCFITGPSRTADIEKRIVLGAHGPVRVIVWGPA